MQTSVRSTKRTAMLAVIALVLSVGLGGAGYVASSHRALVAAYKTSQEEKNVHVRFLMEAYDSIEQNYWIKPGDYARFNVPELPKLFELAAQKIDPSVKLATSTRAGVAVMLSDTLASATSTDAARAATLQTLSLVLYNLPPAGRDGLLSQQQEKSLREGVANVNPQNDLYQDLGLEKGANVAAVNVAYARLAAMLRHATSTDVQERLGKIAYARGVLTTPWQRQLYDAQHVEPSVFSHVLGRTLYLDFKNISPTSLQEFALAVDAASTTPGLDSLIIDMRGNVGGALDFAPAFLGLFIGPQQYAFDLYHQGDQQVQRTTQPRFPELDRFAEVAVLADNQSQSTAELTSAVMKRYRVAHVVGTPTRGWGSVENTYPLKTVIDPSTSYALLLVNSLTLRDDQQPIEQNGVVPDIDTRTAGWQKQLARYFDSVSLRQALTAAAASAPLR